MRTHGTKRVGSIQVTDLVRTKRVLDVSSVNGTIIIGFSIESSEKDEIRVFHRPKGIVLAQFFSYCCHKIGVDEFTKDPNESPVRYDEIDKVIALNPNEQTVKGV
jgi:hypothetical protein